MSETLKKASRKLRGVPEARLMVEAEPFMAHLPNIEIKIRFRYKPMSEAFPIICSCGQKVTEKHAKSAVSEHGVSMRAMHVNEKGKQNQRLIDLYEKIAKRKISATEGFEEELRIRRIYDTIPSDEKPVGSAKASVPFDCPNCEARLGLLEVAVECSPDHPIPPDVEEWVGLKRTPKELRLIRKNLMPDGVVYEDWLSGRDMEGFIQKLESWKEELQKVPYIRSLHKPLSNLSSDIYTAVKSVREEIRTRPSRVYNLLKNPPSPPPRK